MKVAIVLEATLGGTRKHVVDLIQSLRAKEDEVWFFYAVGRADATFHQNLIALRGAGVMCVPLPMTKSLHHPKNLASILRLSGFLRKQRFEVLHAHGAVGGAIARFAALLAGKALQKIIYSPHGGVLHKANNTLIGKVFLKIERALAFPNVSFIAVSSDEQQKLKQLLPLAAQKVALVPNGINVRELQQQVRSKDVLDSLRLKLGLREDDFVILYPALFLEAKGHIPFFRALSETNALAKNVKILLAGHGPLETSVERIVEASGYKSQVNFLGFVTDIPSYLQLADAVILPSVNEAFGYVLLEAMAFGKPVLATRVGGIPDIVEHHRTGLLYDPGSPQSLIEDINRFATHRDALKGFTENALSVVHQRFNSQRTLAAVRELYTAPPR